MRCAVLVCGPESSGTRFIGRALDEHPDLIGKVDGHRDLLTPFWDGDDQCLYSALAEHENILTRRSIPSGRNGQNARYMEFEPYDRFADICREMDAAPVLVVTARSPAPHIASMAETRQSARKEAALAQWQIQDAYRHALNSGIPFLMLPLEAVILDGAACIESVWDLLGLKPHRSTVSARNPNTARYRGADNGTQYVQRA